MIVYETIGSMQTTPSSKDCYLLYVTEKAQPPNIIYKWKSFFNLSDDNLREFFLLPHSVVLESYVKAFQYKVEILYTKSGNTLCK